MQLFLLTALTMIAFAANSVLNRMAVGPGHIGPVDFALVRLVSGALILGGLILWRRASTGRGLWPGPKGRVAGPLALLLYLFGFSFAYGALNAGVGALILFGMVQITMFIGALVLAEAIPPRRWLGAGIAFVGLALLLLPGAEGAQSLPHAMMMAAAGIGWGLYSLSARGVSDPLGATAWNFLLAVPVGLAAGALLPGGLGGGPMDGQGIVLAILSGAVTSGLGYALWYTVLPRLGAARGAVAQLTVPVIAAAGGLVILSEAPSLRMALSSVLVLGGVALASRSAKDR